MILNINLNVHQQVEQEKKVHFPGVDHLSCNGNKSQLIHSNFHPEINVSSRLTPRNT